MKVWKATGEAIDASLREKNGVTVPGFGTFTFRANGQPCFILSDTFARQSRAVQAKPPVPGRTVAHKLNLSRVASIAGVDKHVAGDTVELIARHCASLVNKSRGAHALRVSFHPVAEVTFSNMKVSVTFVTDFLSRLGKVSLTVGHLARHTARHGTPKRASAATPRSNTSFARNVANAAAVAPSDMGSVVTDQSGADAAGRDIVEKIKGTQNVATCCVLYLRPRSKESHSLTYSIHHVSFCFSPLFLKQSPSFVGPVRMAFKQCRVCCV